MLALGPSDRAVQSEGLRLEAGETAAPAPMGPSSTGSCCHLRTKQRRRRACIIAAVAAILVGLATFALVLLLDLNRASSVTINIDSSEVNFRPKGFSTSVATASFGLQLHNGPRYSTGKLHGLSCTVSTFTNSSSTGSSSDRDADVTASPSISSPRDLFTIRLNDSSVDHALHWSGEEGEDVEKIKLDLIAEDFNVQHLREILSNVMHTDEKQNSLGNATVALSCDVDVRLYVLDVGVGVTRVTLSRSASLRSLIGDEGDASNSSGTSRKPNGAPETGTRTEGFFISSLSSFLVHTPALSYAFVTDSADVFTSLLKNLPFDSTFYNKFARTVGSTAGEITGPISAQVSVPAATLDLINIENSVVASDGSGLLRSIKFSPFLGNSRPRCVVKSSSASHSASSSSSDSSGAPASSSSSSSSLSSLQLPLPPSNSSSSSSSSSSYSSSSSSSSEPSPSSSFFSDSSNADIADTSTSYLNIDVLACEYDLPSVPADDAVSNSTAVTTTYPITLSSDEEISTFSPPPPSPSPPPNLLLRLIGEQNVIRLKTTETVTQTNMTSSSSPSSTLLSTDEQDENDNDDDTFGGLADETYHVTVFKQNVCSKFDMRNVPNAELCRTRTESRVYTVGGVAGGATERAFYSVDETLQYTFTVDKVLTGDVSLHYRRERESNSVPSVCDVTGGYTMYSGRTTGVLIANGDLSSYNKGELSFMYKHYSTKAAKDSGLLPQYFVSGRYNYTDSFHTHVLEAETTDATTVQAGFSIYNTVSARADFLKFFGTGTTRFRSQVTEKLNRKNQAPLARLQGSVNVNVDRNPLLINVGVDVMAHYTDSPRYLKALLNTNSEQSLIEATYSDTVNAPASNSSFSVKSKVNHTFTLAPRVMVLGGEATVYLHKKRHSQTNCSLHVDLPNQSFGILVNATGASPASPYVFIDIGASAPPGQLKEARVFVSICNVSYISVTAYADYSLDRNGNYRFHIIQTLDGRRFPPRLDVHQIGFLHSGYELAVGGLYREDFAGPVLTCDARVYRNYTRELMLQLTFTRESNTQKNTYSVTAGVYPYQNDSIAALKTTFVVDVINWSGRIELATRFNQLKYELLHRTPSVDGVASTERTLTGSNDFYLFGGGRRLLQTVSVIYPTVNPTRVLLKYTDSAGDWGTRVDFGLNITGLVFKDAHSAGSIDTKLILRNSIVTCARFTFTTASSSSSPPPSGGTVVPDGRYLFTVLEDDAYPISARPRIDYNGEIAYFKSPSTSISSSVSHAGVLKHRENTMRYVDGKCTVSTAEGIYDLRTFIVNVTSADAPASSSSAGGTTTTSPSERLDLSGDLRSPFGEHFLAVNGFWQGWGSSYTSSHRGSIRKGTDGTVMYGFDGYLSDNSAKYLSAHDIFLRMPPRDFFSFSFTEATHPSDLDAMSNRHRLRFTFDMQLQKAMISDYSTVYSTLMLHGKQYAWCSAALRLASWPPEDERDNYYSLQLNENIGGEQMSSARTYMYAQLQLNNPSAMLRGIMIFFNMVNIRWMHRDLAHVYVEVRKIPKYGENLFEVRVADQYNTLPNQRRLWISANALVTSYSHVTDTDVQIRLAYAQKSIAAVKGQVYSRIGMYGKHAADYVRAHFYMYEQEPQSSGWSKNTALVFGNYTVEWMIDGLNYTGRLIDQDVHLQGEGELLSNGKGLSAVRAVLDVSTFKDKFNATVHVAEARNALVYGAYPPLRLGVDVGYTETDEVELVNHAMYAFNSSSRLYAKLQYLYDVKLDMDVVSVDMYQTDSCSGYQNGTCPAGQPTWLCSATGAKGSWLPCTDAATYGPCVHIPGTPCNSGVGTKERLVSCRHSTSMAPRGDSTCVGPKPPASVTCGTPNNCQWTCATSMYALWKPCEDESTWNTCSVTTCSPTLGSQTRLRSCGSASHNVPDSNCSTPPPVTQRSCSGCPVRWMCTRGGAETVTQSLVECTAAESWSTCKSYLSNSTMCGPVTGKATQYKKCTADGISEVDSSRCPAISQTVTEQYCAMPCLPSEWAFKDAPCVSLNGDCSGSGMRTSGRGCRTTVNGATVWIDESNCEATATNPKPASSVTTTCVAGPNVCAGSWKCASETGVFASCEDDRTWGACASDCGAGAGGSQGISRRTVSCRSNSSGNEISTSQCPLQQPDSIRSCTNPACATYTWVPETRGCAYECRARNEPHAKRGTYYVCKENDMLTVQDSKCIEKVGPKPADNLIDCATRYCDDYYWGCTTSTAANVTMDGMYKCSDGPATGSGWSTCSASCGSGYRSRQVKCIQVNVNDQVIVDNDGLCSATGKPVAVEACNTHACPIYKWHLNHTVACPSCGPADSTGSATFVCRDESGANVHPSNCKDKDPSATMACNVSPCPAYLWTLSPTYSACSSACGPGTRKREYMCVEKSRQHIAVSESLCSGTKPNAEITTCLDKACETSSNYRWIIGMYGACSAPCRTPGEAVPSRIRAVLCVNQSDQVVDNSLCDASTKPQTSDPCNLLYCPGKWTASVWSNCSAACRGGIQTRTIQCASLNGLTTYFGDDETYCATSPKPPLVRECNLAECPKWVVTSTGACSTTCGTGTRPRTVQCVDGAGRVVTDNAAAAQVCTVEAAGAKPASFEPCNTETGKACNYWLTGEFSATCSRSCGGGVMTRDVYCNVNNGHDQFIADYSTTMDIACAHAPTPKPSATQPCNQQACPDANFALYELGPWSQCTAYCGTTGVRTRSLQCVVDGVIQATNAACAQATLPSASLGEACNRFACDTLKWKVLGQSDCSALECGSGSITRSVRCIRETANGDLVSPDDACMQHVTSQTRPADVIACNHNLTCNAAKNGGKCVDGRCVCSNGFTSIAGAADKCTVSPHIESALQVPSSVRVGTRVTARWTYTMPASSSALPPRYLVYLVPSGQSQGVFIGGVTATAEVFAFDVPTTQEPGNFFFKFVFNKDIHKNSDVFKITDLCEDVRCLNGGVCNRERGTCACPAAFTGEACQLNVCKDVLNSCGGASRGVCSTDGASCSCQSEYYGSACQFTRSVCGVNGPVTCVRGVVSPNNPCTQCVCPSSSTDLHWTGASCNTCNSAQHCASPGSTGTANAECTACMCNDGYSGVKCQCKYLVIKLAFSDVPASVSREQFVNNFVREVAYHMNLSSLEGNHRVLNGTIFVAITASVCPSINSSSFLALSSSSTNIRDYAQQQLLDISRFPEPGAAPLLQIAGHDISSRVIATTYQSTRNAELRAVADRLKRAKLVSQHGMILTDSVDEALNLLARDLTNYFLNPDSDLFRGESAQYINSNRGLGLVQPTCQGASCPSSVGGGGAATPEEEGNSGGNGGGGGGSGGGGGGGGGGGNDNIALIAALCGVGGALIIACAIYCVRRHKCAKNSGDIGKGIYVLPDGRNKSNMSKGVEGQQGVVNAIELQAAVAVDAPQVQVNEI